MPVLAQALPISAHQPRDIAGIHRVIRREARLEAAGVTIARGREEIVIRVRRPQIRVAPITIEAVHAARIRERTDDGERAGVPYL